MREMGQQPFFIILATADKLYSHLLHVMLRLIQEF